MPHGLLLPASQRVRKIARSLIGKAFFNSSRRATGRVTRGVRQNGSGPADASPAADFPGRPRARNEPAGSGRLPRLMRLRLWRPRRRRRRLRRFGSRCLRCCRGFGPRGGGLRVVLLEAAMFVFAARSAMAGLVAPRLCMSCCGHRTSVPHRRSVSRRPHVPGTSPRTRVAPATARGWRPTNASKAAKNDRWSGAIFECVRFGGDGGEDAGRQTRSISRESGFVMQAGADGARPLRWLYTGPAQKRPLRRSSPDSRVSSSAKRCEIVKRFPRGRERRTS